MFIVPYSGGKYLFSIGMKKVAFDKWSGEFVSCFCFSDNNVLGDKGCRSDCWSQRSPCYQRANSRRSFLWFGQGRRQSVCFAVDFSLHSVSHRGAWRGRGVGEVGRKGGELLSFKLRAFEF